MAVGPLQGYRQWRADRDGGQPVLWSLHSATLWPAQGPLQGTCAAASRRLAAWVGHVLSPSRIRHAAPTWECQCGIYGLVRLQRADTGAMASLPQRGPWVDGWPVVGAVSLWGRVIPHAHGYRAEYARPLELFAFPAQSCDRERLAVLEAIAHRYAIAGVSDVGERRRH